MTAKFQAFVMPQVVFKSTQQSESLYNCTNINYTINLLTTVRRRAVVASHFTCLSGRAYTGNKAYIVRNVAGTVGDCGGAE